MMKKLMLNILSFATFLPLIIAALAALFYTVITTLFLSIVGLFVYLDPTVKAQACLLPFPLLRDASAWLQAQWSRV
ncbi:MAG: hypothetical protein J5614_08955 [Paludibacteraceae bacterium]|nr:hypothetical protein [Paludibacteraceae bacterium]